jgi:hypothetical protein
MSAMTSRFIGKEITVEVAGELNQPVSFSLEGNDYRIAEITESWPDYGFGKSITGRKRWWQRHHRNYYRVKTTNGDIFEIYYDRGVNRKHPEYRKWFLTRKF